MRAAAISGFPISRDALARLVGACFGPDPVETYSSLDEFLADAKPGRVELVLLELESGSRDLASVKTLVDTVAPAPVALYAMLTPGEAQAAYEAGVKGCVPKTAPADLVTAALKLIAAGGVYFSDIGELVAKPRAEAGLRARLSSRQHDVLKLIEVGQTNKEIAKALGISVATVKLHVQAILNVTGARNRTEAALRARSQLR